MKKRTTIIAAALLSSMLSVAAPADHHETVDDDLRAAIEGFDTAYATNDVEAYFDYYADGATVYFDGARQDVDAYHEQWSAMMKAGGGVEVNKMSDLVIQVMPSGDVAISTSFVDNKTRAPDGSISSARAFETDVWQKIDGQWKIVSLHYSEVPSDD
jgi:ketosteroid isomerase-like protein